MSEQQSKAPDAKSARMALSRYSYAHRMLQLAGAAITILESMNTSEAARAIKTLQGGQQKLLKEMDAAAAKLGAPYHSTEG